jgi:hypothetical protein
MSIIFSPPAIIYLNPDISQQVLSVFVRQLFIIQTLDAATFDGYVAEGDGYYISSIYQDGYRILVLRDLHDQTNRGLADIVLFAKAGLVAVETNKVGPPNLTLPINQVYLTALITQQSPQFPFIERLDIDDGFVGEFDNDDFNPFHLDPPSQRNVEPTD